MSFKTQAEIFTALLDGKTIAPHTGLIVKLVDGDISALKDGEWKKVSANLNVASDWSLHEEPKKVRLYRYTHEGLGEINQTHWTTLKFNSFYTGRAIIKTETKEVEI